MTNVLRGSNAADLRMLVIGAGIAGLGAARALRQRGFAADVVERDPVWTHSGAGIYLPGNAARALRALDLESAVAERAAPIPQQRLCAHSQPATRPPQPGAAQMGAERLPCQLPPAPRAPLMA